MQLFSVIDRDLVDTHRQYHNHHNHPASQLRPFLRHEELSVKMARALHHSAQPSGPVVEAGHETYYGLRAPMPLPPGMRPAPLSEVGGPQRSDRTVPWLCCPGGCYFPQFVDCTCQSHHWFHGFAFFDDRAEQVRRCSFQCAGMFYKDLAGSESSDGKKIDTSSLIRFAGDLGAEVVFRMDESTIDFGPHWF